MTETIERLTADVERLLPHFPERALLDASTTIHDLIQQFPTNDNLRRAQGRINGELQRRAKTND